MILKVFANFESFFLFYCSIYFILILHVWRASTKSDFFSCSESVDETLTMVGRGRASGYTKCLHDLEDHMHQQHVFKRVVLDAA